MLGCALVTKNRRTERTAQLQRSGCQPIGACTMRSTSTTASTSLIALLVFVNIFAGSGAVFTGRPVFLRWARVEETAALFANSTPNTEILHEPIQKAAESALIVRFVCLHRTEGAKSDLSRTILIAASRMCPHASEDSNHALTI